ncbi:PQQ-binding-like beta-propeller repeat protein [Lysinibacillus xylanilyticus]|uniref:outer membrane protein assembly factor BamB family protein n=1 Tax=Lysinibacillus xylanilyticus TaxID=582475 RepID=UPI0038142DC1
MINNPDTRDGSVTTLAKYSPTGSLIKKVTVSDPNRGVPSGVTVNGNFLAFYAYTNIYLYDLDLTLLTTIPIVNRNSAVGGRVALTTSGDVYVGVRVWKEVGGDDSAILKYNRYGGLIWTKTLDNRPEIADIRLLSDGNIVIGTSYGGYSVQKLQASDGAILWTVALYTMHTPANVYVNNLRQVVETSDGNIIVSYSGGNANYTPARDEVMVRIISPSGSVSGGYITLNNMIGPQYNYAVHLCTDGNGGVYFATSGDFYWRQTTNNDMANINYNIIGRLNENLSIVWNQIYSQGWSVYGDRIWALTYDPLSDSVIASQGQGTWSYGVIRKWDWYVSLK